MTNIKECIRKYLECHGDIFELIINNFIINQNINLNLKLIFFRLSMLHTNINLPLLSCFARSSANAL